MIRQAGPLDLPALLQAFEIGSRGEQFTPAIARELGTKLIDALADSPARESLIPARIRSALVGFPEPVRAAAANRFPDAAPATAELTARIAEIESIADQGNADSGKHLFFSNRAACTGCHRIGDQGGAVGPDLSRIGGIRSTRQLAEAIVLPSATLAGGFESYTLLTQSGLVLSGLVRRETADAIYLVSSDGREHRISRAEIEGIQPSAVSIMPQGLDQQLTTEQLRDLVAVLSTLQ